MTTKHSPLSQLRTQAERIAMMLKRAERGELIPAQYGALRIEAARQLPTFKTGLVMDDKVVTIELTWTRIAETTEPALAEYILDLMRESRDAEH